MVLIKKKKNLSDFYTQRFLEINKIPKNILLVYINSRLI